MGKTLERTGRERMEFIKMRKFSNLRRPMSC